MFFSLKQILRNISALNTYYLSLGWLTSIYCFYHILSLHLIIIQWNISILNFLLFNLSLMILINVNDLLMDNYFCMLYTRIHSVGRRLWRFIAAFNLDISILTLYNFLLPWVWSILKSIKLTLLCYYLLLGNYLSVIGWDNFLMRPWIILNANNLVYYFNTLS